MSLRTLCLISGFLLFLAIPAGWPYFFYTLLRWIICISSGIVAVKFFESKITAWSLIFGGVAILFNPIFPVYLEKASWVSLDFICSALFFLAAFSVKVKK